MRCGFLKSRAPSTFVIGGKFGDIVQMLGAFHEIWRRSGQKPNVVSSREFASVYEGVSYVNAVPVAEHWYGGLVKMRAIAQSMFGSGDLLQFWHDTSSPEFAPARFRGGIVLQSHGVNFAVDMQKDPHYGASMMRRAGFSWEEALKLRPVFDRRNPAREAALLAQHYPPKMRSKPLLLLALDGQSSPWGHQPEFFRELGHAFRAFHVVDLSKFKAHRVFDLVSLLEAAAGLITVDSLCLHLASACDVPYVAFTQNGWTSSVPKGNCRLEIKYSNSLQRLKDILPHLNGWASTHVSNPHLQQLQPA